MTEIIEKIKPIMVFTNDQLHDCVAFLNKSSEISLDLEFDKNRLRYGFNLCLMQIYCDKKCFIIDPLSKDLDITIVFPVFENPDIIKIVFAFGEDLRLLLLLGCRPKNIFDLATLSRLMDYPALSLSNLLLEVTGIESAKSSQLSDWFKRPLTEKQLNYAVDDVVYLPTIKEAFENEERFQLISSWFEQESAILETMTYSYKEDEDAFLKRKDKLKMTEYEWHMYVELMKFRNKTAKSFKRPPHFIMPTELVKELVESPSKINDWQNLPRIFKRIKTSTFQKKISSCVAQANKVAEEKKLSKTKGAIPALSIAQKKSNRNKRSLEEKIIKDVFKPIQKELVLKIGANTTNYIFSNRVIADLVSKTNDLLPYRMKLVEKMGKELGLEIKDYV